MQIGLRKFSSETISWFRRAVGTEDRTRWSLSRELCERENWRDRTGKLCVSAAACVLPRLADRLGLALPAPREVGWFARREDGSESPFRDIDVACSLAELGPVALEPVGDADDRRRWEAMMARFHSHGWSRAPGGQMRYWVRGEYCGALGGISFTAATWHLRARDAFIGWSADALAANLDRVVYNQRLLLLPGVRVHGLASRVLGMATERVAGDWEAKYGVRPLLAYSFTELRQPGHSYSFARWRRVGETEGRRADANGGGRGEPRAVWVKPLEADWRERLCREPRRPLGSAAGLHVEGDWAAAEYGRTFLTDGRLRARIESMGRAWLQCPGKDITEIFPEKASRKAAYRLLSNPRATMDHILASHYEATVERARGEPLVLAVQDTTALNYSGHSAARGLVALGGGGKGSSGLAVHAGLAITPSGRPLGLFGIDADFRAVGGKKRKGECESRRWVNGLERAGELAAACADTRVVTVCDREGDFWELLAAAETTGESLLVRASASTRRKVVKADGSRACLWSHMAGMAPLTRRTLKIPACGGKRARASRKAKLEVRAAEVTLEPPKTATHQTPLTLLAVSATETGKPKKPLHWLLLTTERPEPGRGLSRHAVEMLKWYRRRWTIELYFKALKSGTRIKDRRLGHADDLRTCFAFDAVTAVRVFDFQYLARERPDLPATVSVRREEIYVLYKLLRHQGHRHIRGPPPDGDPPKIRTFVIDMARLVGSHPTKRQPLPGTKKIWRGFLKLQWAVIVYNALSADDSQ